MLNDTYQSMAANAICHAANMAAEEWRAAGAAHGTPSAVWKPRLFIDGNRWCALYGDNLQDGVAGFGDSPAAAMWDFDKAWNTIKSKLYAAPPLPTIAEGEQDLNKCPNCGGPADNGHDRCYPPNPYYCKKCNAAPEYAP